MDEYRVSHNNITNEVELIALAPDKDISLAYFSMDDISNLVEIFQIILKDKGN
jgi:hypothetical protein